MRQGEGRERGGKRGDETRRGGEREAERGDKERGRGRERGDETRRGEREGREERG